MTTEYIFAAYQNGSRTRFSTLRQIIMKQLSELQQQTNSKEKTPNTLKGVYVFNNQETVIESQPAIKPALVGTGFDSLEVSDEPIDDDQTFQYSQELII